MNKNNIILVAIVSSMLYCVDQGQTENKDIEVMNNNISDQVDSLINLECNCYSRVLDYSDNLKMRLSELNCSYPLIDYLICKRINFQSRKSFNDFVKKIQTIYSQNIIDCQKFMNDWLDYVSKSSKRSTIEQQF